MNLKMKMVVEVGVNNEAEAEWMCRGEFEI